MRLSLVIFLSVLFFGQVFAQDKTLILENEENLEADTFIGIDKFDNFYFLKDNTLFKKEPNNKEIAFQDVLLGDITRVDILNPNKIIVFYQMANVVVILDNRLTEIDRQDFNSLFPFKNVGHAGTSKDQSLWIYNIDLNQLELFDYRYNTTIAQSLPIDEDILDIQNNFNYCFLQTKDSILVYNIYGSLLKTIYIKGLKTFKLYKNNLVAFVNGKLWFFNDKFETTDIIKVEFEDYDSLFYKDEKFYLYSDNILNKYIITTKT